MRSSRWMWLGAAASAALAMASAGVCWGEEGSSMAQAGLARASAGATTYYVDGSRGDDGNDGKAPDKAWRSLDRVNEIIFAPGDRVLFRAGTNYAGQLRPQGRGKSGSPIVIDMFGQGPKPRIDGEGRHPATVLLYNVEYWEIRNLEITNTGTTPGDRRSGVVMAIEDFGTAHHIRLEGLYVHDVNGSNVKGEGGSGIGWVNGGRKVRSRFDDLRIEGCHLVRTDRNGITGWSEHWTREGWYPSLNVVIRGNLLEDIGGDGIVPIGCDGALVERNVLRGGRQRAPDYAAGIWPWSCDNTVIQLNEVSGMKGTKDGQGFDSDWNCRNTTIQYNYSHDNEGGFVLICNDGNVKPPTSVGNLGTVVRYNISQNDGARTFQISAVEDTAIYNNAIYTGRDLDIWLTYFHDWGGQAKDTRFWDNIFYVRGRARYELGGSVDTVFAHNIFYGNHDGRPPDAKAITVDPMLGEPGSGRDGLDSVDGYRLRPGSPCAGAGIAVADNGGRDFWGNGLPQEGSPDIGAHQASQ